MTPEQEAKIAKLIKEQYNIAFSPSKPGRTMRIRAISAELYHVLTEPEAILPGVAELPEAYQAK